MKPRFVTLLHSNRAFSDFPVPAPPSFPFLRVSEFQQHPRGRSASRFCKSVRVRTASHGQRASDFSESQSSNSIPARNAYTLLIRPADPVTLCPMSEPHDDRKLTRLLDN